MAESRTLPTTPQTDKFSDMSSPTPEPLGLRPLSITLSLLHTDSALSALNKDDGVDVYLPKAEGNDTRHFKAVIQEVTSASLMLESFYDAQVKNRSFKGVQVREHSLASYGVSRCVFSTPLGLMQGETRMNDRTAPKFQVRGISYVPLFCQGHQFYVRFLLVDHIFGRQEFESNFHAVLGLDFLTRCFIRVQWTTAGYSWSLPPPLDQSFDKLIIYTDGCCLSNGQSRARAGYGIHFHLLPSSWDISGPLGAHDIHTNQRAELTAVIRAIELVMAYNVPCKKVQIFTDSIYAVKGLNEWIPRWRENGYRTSKGKKVKNTDRFKSLAEKALKLRNEGFDLSLDHVPREKNREADALAKNGAALAKKGAAFISPSISLKSTSSASAKSGKPMTQAAGASPEVSMPEPKRPGLIIGRDFFMGKRPLVQWTPDGSYWVDWKGKNSPQSNSEEPKATKIVVI